MMTPAIWLLLLFTSAVATHPTASVAAVDKVECLPGSAGIQISLTIELNNHSPEPLILGRLEIAKEKFYRPNAHGKLVLIDVSSAPDQFVSNPSAPPEHIPEETLAVGSRKRIALDHIIYFMPHEVLTDAKGQRILVSFDIANVPNNGRVPEYWTAPVSIAIPKGCSLR